jgi:hypothetical protein
MSTCVREKVLRLLPPENCSATFDSLPDCITLAWDTISNAKYYVIYRSAVTCEAGMIKIDSTTQTGYTDTVTTSDKYYYRIAGIDDVGIEGQRGECITGRVRLLDAPEQVKASCGLYSDRIRISWQAVPRATGYVIVRGTTNILENAHPVDTVTSLFQFDSVNSTDLIYYWVCARNELGNSRFSSFLFGRTLNQTELQVIGDTTGILLSWKMDTAIVRSSLYRYESDTSAYLLVADVEGTTFHDDIDDYGVRTYMLISKTAAGDSCISIGEGLKRLVPPTGFSAISDSSGIHLSWDVLPNAEKYFLYRSLLPDDTLLLREISDTTYLDRPVLTGDYFYRVVGVNNYQLGMFSNVVKVRTMRTGK